MASKFLASVSLSSRDSGTIKESPVHVPSSRNPSETSSATFRGIFSRKRGTAAAVDRSKLISGFVGRKKKLARPTNSRSDTFPPTTEKMNGPKRARAFAVLWALEAIELGLIKKLGSIEQNLLQPFLMVLMGLSCRSGGPRGRCPLVRELRHSIRVG